VATPVPILGDVHVVRWDGGRLGRTSAIALLGLPSLAGGMPVSGRLGQLVGARHLMVQSGRRVFIAVGAVGVDVSAVRRCSDNRHVDVVRGDGGRLGGSTEISWLLGRPSPAGGTPVPDELGQ
jgi:hypothetical protein